MVQEVELANLVLDYNFYPRQSVSDITIKAMAEACEAGRDLPPILVDMKSMRVVDGFHRYYRALRAGETTIQAEMQAFKNEQELFEAAAAANSNHGRPYTPFDKARIISIGLKLKISKQRLAGALNMSVGRVEEIRLSFAKVGREEEPSEPLKGVIKHLKGKRLTKEQAQAQRKLGGMQATFYANQLIILIENDLLNIKDGVILTTAHRLASLIQERVPMPETVKNAA
jgi:hypothetical protein